MNNAYRRGAQNSVLLIGYLFVGSAHTRKELSSLTSSWVDLDIVKGGGLCLS